MEHRKEHLKKINNLYQGQVLIQLEIQIDLILQVHILHLVVVPKIIMIIININQIQGQDNIIMILLCHQYLIKVLLLVKSSIKIIIPYQIYQDQVNIKVI